MTIIQRFDTHICLVSEQTLPNLLPTLYEPFRPQRVLLLVTPAMHRQAQRLEQVLGERGIHTQRSAVSAYSFEAMRQQVFTVASTIEGSAALNLTGGTKIMALGAFDIARDFDLPVFYLDSREQRLLLLRPDGLEIPLPELLKVKMALTAQGYHIGGQGELRIPPENRALTDQLVSQADRLKAALGTLNFIAAKAKRRMTQPLDLPQRPPEAFDQLLALFRQAHLLDVANNQLLFRDEAARSYVNGGWLEEYCLKIAQQLKQEGHIFDLQPNLEIVTSSGVKNEIDLAFTAHNQLHIVECKTSKLSKSLNENSGETRAAETGYKLDTLRDLAGGSFGKAMLASYLALPPYDRMRCESYRIKVVQSRRLAFLREELLQWIG